MIMLLRRLGLLFAVSVMACAALSQETVPEKSVAQDPAYEQPDATEIIRRSLSHWRRNLDAARNYTFRQRAVEEELNKDGSIKKTEIATHEILIIYGEPYEKLVARDDKPLSGKDQQKEEEKLNKFFEKQQKKSDEDREKERAKQRDKFQREIADELPLMLNYELVGETELEGQPVWEIRATPKPDYKSHSMAGKLLSKMGARVWITKADYQWVKAECDLLDDFTVGWFLFKLHKGTHLEFEQARINDEVWLPRSFFLQGSGRFTVKTGRFRNTVQYSDYHKFKADVKVTLADQEQLAPQVVKP
jgi:hypothetical protein